MFCSVYIYFKSIQRDIHTYLYLYMSEYFNKSPYCYFVVSRQIQPFYSTIGSKFSCVVSLLSCTTFHLYVFLLWAFVTEWIYSTWCNGYSVVPCGGCVRTHSTQRSRKFLLLTKPLCHPCSYAELNSCDVTQTVKYMWRHNFNMRGLLT